MTSEAVFFLTDDDIDAASARLASVATSPMHRHESSYRGGVYYRSSLPDGTTLILQRNADLEDDEPVEAGYGKASVLLIAERIVDYGSLAGLVQAGFPGAKVIRSR